MRRSRRSPIKVSRDFQIATVALLADFEGLLERIPRREFGVGSGSWCREMLFEN